MHHFSYRDGVLHAEGVSLADLAETVGTPLYCYSSATLERHYRVLAEAFAGTPHLICYALKANSNQAVIKTLAALGAGADVVSEGELRRARAAGIPPERIIFAGVGKTRPEMAYALREGILGFNVESEAELTALSEIATGQAAIAHIAIRVNPDVDAGTHAKITTGTADNKFGVPYEQAHDLYAQAARLPGISVRGIHVHIGSQITELAPFRKALERVRTLAVELLGAGHKLAHLDLGGGLGVPYRTMAEPPPGPREYAAVVKDVLADLELPLVLEPGRMIVANAGILLTRVIYTKPGGSRTFTIVDAAMNDLIRPTLYEAYHEVWPVAEARLASAPTRQDIVGPVCESGDYLAKDRMHPPAGAGDLLAIMTAGAYGAVMASTYNSRLLAPEVLVRGTDYAVVRPRPAYEDMIGLDRLPPWL